MTLELNIVQPVDGALRLTQGLPTFPGEVLESLRAALVPAWLNPLQQVKFIFLRKVAPVNMLPALPAGSEFLVKGNKVNFCNFLTAEEWVLEMWFFLTSPTGSWLLQFVPFGTRDRWHWAQRSCQWHLWSEGARCWLYTHLKFVGANVFHEFQRVIHKTKKAQKKRKILTLTL